MKKNVTETQFFTILREQYQPKIGFFNTIFKNSVDFKDKFSVFQLAFCFDFHISD